MLIQLRTLCGCTQIKELYYREKPPELSVAYIPYPLSFDKLADPLKPIEVRSRRFVYDHYDSDLAVYVYHEVPDALHSSHKA